MIVVYVMRCHQTRDSSIVFGKKIKESVFDDISTKGPYDIVSKSQNNRMKTLANKIREPFNSNGFNLDSPSAPKCEHLYIQNHFIAKRFKQNTFLIQIILHDILLATCQ